MAKKSGAKRARKRAAVKIKKPGKREICNGFNPPFIGKKKKRKRKS
jgi:hypothetical protein